MEQLLQWVGSHPSLANLVVRDFYKVRNIWRAVNLTELLKVINAQFWEQLLERSVNAPLSLPQVLMHYCLPLQVWMHQSLSLSPPTCVNAPLYLSPQIWTHLLSFFPQVWVMAFSFDKTGHWKEELIFQLSLSAWDPCLTVGQALWDICRIFANLQEETLSGSSL